MLQLYNKSLSLLRGLKNFNIYRTLHLANLIYCNANYTIFVKCGIIILQSGKHHGQTFKSEK